jgi:hypothetical protein
MFSRDVSVCCGAVMLPLLRKCRIVAVALEAARKKRRGSWQSLGDQSVSRSRDECQVIACQTRVYDADRLWSDESEFAATRSSANLPGLAGMQSVRRCGFDGLGASPQRSGVKL